MRADDLDLKDLVDLDPEFGVVRFAGRRALLFDAAAMGLLRRQLVDVAGWSAARAALTQLGYVHGFRMAEALRAELSHGGDVGWREAGGLVHMLQGFIRMAPGSLGPLSPGGATVASSFEAEQHVLFFGISEAPACWLIAGFASGYTSCAEGRPMVVREDRCAARGDAACHFVGRPADAWGDEAGDWRDLFPSGVLDGPMRVALEALVPLSPLDPLAPLAPPVALGGAPYESAVARRDRRARSTSAPIIAESPGMRQAVDLAARAALTGATVLVSGESGAGKERIARLVHEASPRAAGPFVAVNCAAVSEALFESELFGHARGAFTGATRDRIGLFEAAHGGTLLLDEVGEVPPGAQAKLLRALAERRVRRVGENASRPADARIVAASNRELAGEVAAGRFREDLYYRLNVVELRVPPLRERREDVLPLARAFLAAASGRAGRKVAGFTPRAAEALLRHAWPGNVRELENAMERVVALAQGRRVDVDDLPESVRSAPRAMQRGAAGVRSLSAVEREHILAVLAANGGNQATTAEQLGIGVSTLYRRLRDYGVGGQSRGARRTG